MPGFDLGRTYHNRYDSVLDAGNVGELEVGWIGVAGGSLNSEPAVANGFVFVGSEDGKLYAFAAQPGSSCMGTPKLCGPVWTANIGTSVPSSPAVSKGVVYVVGSDGLISAFDAAGVRGCGGAPKVCAPLWTAATGSNSSPVVAYGNVYVNTYTGLAAFDAAGTVGCAGTPKVCQPLWRGAEGEGAPVVAGTTVYVTTRFAVVGYSAAGCGGAPGTVPQCAPGWIGRPWCVDQGSCQIQEPAYEDGRLYVSTMAGNFPGGLAIFDFRSGVGCPSNCRPTWETQADWAPASFALNDRLAVQTQRSRTGEYGDLVAYNTRVPCESCFARSEFHADIGSPSSNTAITDGIVFVGNRDGELMAFNAGGGGDTCNQSTGVCRPLWSAKLDDVIWRVVAANGTVYATTASGRIYAYN